MKKTLAAVLAAAMALSTATVALATDIRGDAGFEEGDLLGGTTYSAKMGDTSKYILENITDMDDTNTIPGSDLAWAINEGYLTPSVVVTSNQNKLDGRPTLTTGKTKSDVVVGDQTLVNKFSWNGVEGNSEIKSATFVYDYTNTDKNGGASGTATSTNKFSLVLDDISLHDDYKGNNFEIFTLSKDEKVRIDGREYAWDTVMKQALNNMIIAEHYSGPLSNYVYVGREAIGDTVYDKNNALRLSFKINHTYGTDSVTVKMKMRFTVKKVPDGGLTLGSETYKKGDTITSEELSFKAQYNELSNYYEDMQLTSSEVGANNVILNGSNLYDAIGAKNFSISFGDDVAIFTAKAAANQKTVNLYWSLDEISEIKDQYPDVDFTFLTFKGNPSPVFQNTGTMYFAADDKDYQVYSWDGEVLEPLTGKFDSTYKVIEVKGIKKLGTYVIADQILEVEEEPEEPAEPVDSTPVAEPDDEGQNPNTGAC